MFEQGMAETKYAIDLQLSILVFSLCFVCILRFYILIVNDIAEELWFATPLDSISVTVYFELNANSHVLLVYLVNQVVFLDVGQRLPI